MNMLDAVTAQEWWMQASVVAKATVACIALLAGCASHSETPASRTSAPAAQIVSEVKPTSVATTRPASEPFLIREAKLPEGYPPPGPVGTVIVKQYPPSRLAMVSNDDANEVNARRSPNDMFGPLFNHISKNDIKMTAPVIIGYGGEKQDDAAANVRPASMAFVYASREIGTPGAAGDAVHVIDVPPMTVASIGVRGSLSDARWRDAIAQIERWLESEPGRAYSRGGPPRYLAYNSPFVHWFLKYGEVQLPLK